MLFIEGLPTWAEGTVFIGIWVVLGLLGLVLIRNFAYAEHVRNSKDSIIALMNILSILFAVLMAFLVVVVWENYDKNSDNVASEGNYLTNLNRDSKLLGDSNYIKLKPILVDYAYEVASHEWKQMADSGKTDSKTWTEINQFSDALNGVDLNSRKKEILYDNILKEYNHLIECRRIRSSAASSELPDVLWLTIIAGCVATLIFSYFFYFEKFFLHVLLTAIISFMMGMTLFLIFVLAHPFKDNYRIQPDTFVSFYNRMKDHKSNAIEWKDNQYHEVIPK